MTRRDVLRGTGFAFCAQDFFKAAQDAPLQALPGTQLLSWQGDLSERMMDGAHKYVERKIAESVKARQRYWSRDLSSSAAYEKSVERNRIRFRIIIGVVDAREPVMMERFGDEDDSPLVAETEAYRIHQVRWPVLEGVSGEGLLLEPKSSPAGFVIALPDADQTPEQITGLAAGIAAEKQFARHLAENGFEVVVPTLIDRRSCAGTSPPPRAPFAPRSRLCAAPRETPDGRSIRGAVDPSCRYPDGRTTGNCDRLAWERQL